MSASMDCLFNAEVLCDGGLCTKCGWGPNDKVRERRIRAAKQIPPPYKGCAGCKIHEREIRRAHNVPIQERDKSPV